MVKILHTAEIHKQHSRIAAVTLDGTALLYRKFKEISHTRQTGQMIVTAQFEKIALIQ